MSETPPPEKPDSPKTVQTGQAPDDPQAVQYQPAVPSQPAPSPSGGQPPPSQPVPEKRQRRGCLRCGGCFLLVIACCAVTTSGIFGLPFLRGLFGPNAEVLYSGAPDPIATARFNEVLDDANLAGASAVVLPIKGENGQIAVITLDESQGYTGGGASTLGGVIDGLVEANQEGDYNVTRVALDYRGEDGENLTTFATDQESIEAFHSGEISREDFMGEVDIDLSNVFEVIQTYSELEE